MPRSGRLRGLLVAALLMVPQAAGAQYPGPPVHLPERSCHAQHSSGWVAPWWEVGFRQYDPGVFVSDRSLKDGTGWVPSAEDCDGFRIVVLADLKIAR